MRLLIDLHDIWYIFLNTAFVIIAAKVFFDLFLEPKQWKTSFLIPIMLIFCWQIITSIHRYSIFIVIATNVLYITLLTLLMYKGNSFTKLAFSALHVTVCVFVEFIVGYIFLIANINISANVLYGSIISKAITIGLLYVFKHLKQMSKITNYTKRHSWLILVTPIASLILMYIVFKYNLTRTTRANLELSLLSVGILLFANFVVLKVYQLLIREFEITKMNLRFLDQAELHKEHSEEIELMLNNIRKINHNIKHQFIVLRGYLEENEISNAKKFLDDSINEEWNKCNVCNTDNIAIDTIINSKYLKISENKISFNLDINIPASIPFSGVDLSILIGNVLENAIDANLKVEENKRYVNLYITYENNYLIVSCVNIFTGVITKSSTGIINTIKEDKNNHGFGMNSIKNICEKYNGSMNFENTNNVFTIKCILFISP